MEELITTVGIGSAAVVILFWGFKKLLSSVLDMGEKQLDVISTNATALTGLKDEVRESRSAAKENTNAMKQIHDFWQKKNGELSWDKRTERRSGCLEKQD